MSRWLCSIQSFSLPCIYIAQGTTTVYRFEPWQLWPSVSPSFLVEATRLTDQHTEELNSLQDCPPDFSSFESSFTHRSMVPSPRLVFPQVLEYLLQEDVNAGLKSLWNANQNAKQITGTAIFFKSSVGSSSDTSQASAPCSTNAYMQYQEEEKGHMG